MSTRSAPGLVLWTQARRAVTMAGGKALKGACLGLRALDTWRTVVACQGVAALLRVGTRRAPWCPAVAQKAEDWLTRTGAAEAHTLTRTPTSPVATKPHPSCVSQQEHFGLRAFQKQAPLLCVVHYDVNLPSF